LLTTSWFFNFNAVALFSLALTMAISFLSLGQEKTITGVVSDESGVAINAKVGVVLWNLRICKSG
jgi:hypothetical protein